MSELNASLPITNLSYMIFCTNNRLVKVHWGTFQMRERDGRGVGWGEAIWYVGKGQHLEVFFGRLGIKWHWQVKVSCQSTSNEAGSLCLNIRLIDEWMDGVQGYYASKPLLC